jgi:hypothetical protein
MAVKTRQEVVVGPQTRSHEARVAEAECRAPRCDQGRRVWWARARLRTLGAPFSALQTGPAKVEVGVMVVDPRGVFHTKPKGRAIESTQFGDVWRWE